MDLDRSYLSVTIPVHEYFLLGKQTEKQIEYEQKLLTCLQDSPLDLTSLAKAMGYKGISEKLRTTVESLIGRKKIRRILDGRKIRYTI